MRFCGLLIWGLLLTLNVFGQTDTVQKVVEGRRNSAAQQKKPYVILISADGFRYDYPEKYNTEHLKVFGQAGVRAVSMLPSFPSVTFPNHYTLITGLYPAHHGLVNNSFYDRDLKDSYYYKSPLAVQSKWYGGKPLWVLAEEQQMLTAVFYWVGSDALIKGKTPTYYYKYNEKIGINERIQTVVKWLKLPADRRPHLIAMYFPEVDHISHNYGPDAPQTREAVRVMDSTLYELNKAVKTTGLDVNFLFVSDHGTTKVDQQNLIPLPAAADTAKFIIKGDGFITELYAKPGSDIQGAYESIKAGTKNFDVYLKTDAPARWHHAVKDDWHNRVGDILMVPHWPKVINLNYKRISPGQHGYDPCLVKDMHAIFYAWGPAFKNNLTIPAFENVNVYPVVTQLLGLKQTSKIDGNNKVANQVLRAKKQGRKASIKK